MGIGSIVSGTLISAAGTRLGRALTGKRSVMMLILSVLLAGAFLSVIAGNALVVVTGTAWRGLGLPRPIGIAGIVLGGAGLVSIP
jgi:hypothetical protein